MSEPIVTPSQLTTTPLRTTRVNGHRGQSFTAPENTLPAFLDAAALGADGIEFDVHLTADGHVVAHHDQTLRRTTDVARVFPGRAGDPISSFTAAELARLDAGSWKGDLWAGTPLPFVADIVKAFRDRPHRMSIELKATSANPLVFAMALRAAVGARENVTFMSFRRPLLDAVRQAIPGAQVGLVSVRRPRTVDLESYDEFHLDATFLTQRVVDQIHDRGKTVTAWTVDSPAQAARLAAIGVDAITTNRVDVVRRALV
ncbi:hypothetical protein D9V41_07675 [Aeromicrobium phragmitis]|uniref:GP-PDE domain-containing protein n=1 Tax=Aeromicrobium phragmitis TaxID=2478914 RepID=A0A3L8PPC5_9ACTN|nr:glycerophosphodiester phosphodiesterase family protein [Aeromicrobium phragmitis]RLV56298.1 hypothetical protein D9V41_07675 [Aeromicrobium phragmitis]